MRKLIHRIRQFVRREDGPTAVEYAVMLAMIVIVVPGGNSHARHQRQDDVHQHRELAGQLGPAPGLESTSRSWPIGANCQSASFVILRVGPRLFGVDL